jgi:hypothetical protein
VSQPVVAGPRLIEVSDDILDWVGVVREWESFLRDNTLQALITDRAIPEANAHGHWPVWQDVSDRLKATGSELEVADIMRTFSFLTGRFKEVPEDALVLATAASGCLNSQTCQRLSPEIAAAAICTRDEEPIIAGAAATETETISATVYRLANAECEQESDESVDVTCTQLPSDFIRLLQIPAWIDTPALALEATQARMAATGAPHPDCTVAFLPTFVPSLRHMPRPKWADVIRTVAVLALEPSSRPRGPRERPIRTGAGPNADQMTSSWGKAYRATLSTHGTGWRLHYWRDTASIVVAVVADHDTLDIPV